MKRISLTISLLLAATVVVGLITNDPHLWQASAVALAASVAVGIRNVPSLKTYQFTAWVITAVVAAMIFPQAFVKWGNVELRNKWLLLVVIQFVMFGMGTHIKVKDFTGLSSTGKGVLIGIACHFTVMPLVGYTLTKIFNFEPEIAAGVILIGSCSSGLASNVMVYIARANLVLSVIVTAMATLAAPFLTPLLMKLLAGTYIEVKFTNMMVEIIKIVLIPIFAALLHDYLKTATPNGRKIINRIGLVGLIWLLALPVGLWNYLNSHIFNEFVLISVELLGFLLASVVMGVIYHRLVQKYPKLDDIMPAISMTGIIYFTLVTTAAGRESLMSIGFLLFLCSVIHNGAGYFFGYWLSRLFGLDVNSARTVAFEVGLQNGGMASGLAAGMGKLGTVGVPAAIFSAWMNISGSLLANYWRRKPVEQ